MNFIPRSYWEEVAYAKALATWAFTRWEALPRVIAAYNIQVIGAELASQAADRVEIPGFVPGGSGAYSSGPRG